VLNKRIKNPANMATSLTSHTAPAKKKNAAANKQPGNASSRATFIPSSPKANFFFAQATTGIVTIATANDVAATTNKAVFIFSPKNSRYHNKNRRKTHGNKTKDDQASDQKLKLSDSGDVFTSFPFSFYPSANEPCHREQRSSNQKK
jgi:hypothetical protein